jgi:uncharacterized HAD superfamily protein
LLRQHEFHEKAIPSINIIAEEKSTLVDHCAEEIFLLAWLEHYYEQQRVRDWMIDHRVILDPHEKLDIAEQRQINNFHSDLSDSLVLMAVTAAYCPCLIDECFNNFYIIPRNKGEVI